MGDDLFVTNTKRLDAGIKLGVANAILVRLTRLVQYQSDGSY